MSDPFDVVRSFEKDLCEYTGAPYAVAVNSCTMALLLACAWWREEHHRHGVHQISLPKLTYVGVPYAVKEAGFDVGFREDDWQGEYLLEGSPIWDSARRFTAGMFGFRCSAVGHRVPATGPRIQALSFHYSKILGHSQGGALVHNLPEADVWLRRARLDGRTEGVSARADTFNQRRAWHAYLSPDVAAALRWNLSTLPRHNADLPRSDYADLSLHEAFQ